MSAAQVKSLYASMPENLAKARRKFGRPLTLSEKILVAHCHDFEKQEWERGKAWAFEQAMGLVWYYADSNPAMSRMGRRTLERIQADL